MDDTAQSKAQSDDQQGGTTPAQEVPQSGTQSWTQQSPSTQPVSLPHKELGPSRPTHDYGSVSLSEPEPYISEEVAEAGVEVTPDTYRPDIPSDVVKLGVTPAKAATPVVTTSTGKITLPLTQESAQTAKKTYSIRDSMRWLAELVLEQLKRVQEKVIN